MRRLWLAAALAVAVAVVAVLSVQAAYARGVGSHAGWSKPNATCPNATAARHVGRMSRGLWGLVGRHGGWKDVALYDVSRSISLQGQGISLSLKVDVVTRNATAGYGAVVYGTGSLQLGGSSYTVKSAMGALAPNGLRLLLYTDGGLVWLTYRGGRYYAVAKAFGQRGYAAYNGTAQLNLS